MFKQHGIIKFYDKWRKSSRETLEILRAAYSEAIIKQSTGFEWHKMFKEWKENVKDDRRSGRPKTHSMCKKMWKDRWLNTLLTAGELNLDRKTVRNIVTDDLETFLQKRSWEFWLVIKIRISLTFYLLIRLKWMFSSNCWRWTLATQKQNVEACNEKQKIHQDQKSANAMIKDQNLTNLFFR